MHAEAAEAKSVTHMIGTNVECVRFAVGNWLNCSWKKKPGSGATDALLGQQDLVALSSACFAQA